MAYHLIKVGQRISNPGGVSPARMHTVKPDSSVPLGVTEVEDHLLTFGLRVSSSSVKWLKVFELEIRRGKPHQQHSGAAHHHNSRILTPGKKTMKGMNWSAYRYAAECGWGEEEADCSRRTLRVVSEFVYSYL